MGSRSKCSPTSEPSWPDVSSLNGRWLRHGYLGQTRRPHPARTNRVHPDPVDPDPIPDGQMYYVGVTAMRYADDTRMEYA